MPSSRSGNKGREFPVCSEFVLFLSLLEVDLLPDSVIKVDLANDHVVPRWCTGVCNGSSALSLKPPEEFLPSKSAMYVQTLEFNALTTIFRSVGPVISVLLSTKPGAGVAPLHAGLSRIRLVSGRKSGSTPLSSSAWRMSRRCSSSLRRALNERWSRARKAVASLLKILLVRLLRGPRIDTPWMIASMFDMLNLCLHWICVF